MRVKNIILHRYLGFDKEVPKDVTHAIVDDSVTIIKKDAFFGCEYLVSIIMGDNVKRIEEWAFFCCLALQSIRLSRTLEYIGLHAFNCCHSLEALFLPSTVKSIKTGAFIHCHSLRLLILPHAINHSNIGIRIIDKRSGGRRTIGHTHTNVLQFATAADVAYKHGDYASFFDESSRRLNEWLIHHMDHAPFHKLCYNSSITTRQIIDYLNENGNDSALHCDAILGMIPLHILSMNPHAPAETIGALLNSNTETIFCQDSQQKTPLDYARDYNVGGMIGMINALCNHRNSSTPLEASDWK